MTVLTIGEALGVLRSPGRIATDPALTVGVGGAEFNVAVGLQRLGVPAMWLGRLGPDCIGQRIRRELRAEGVTLLAIDDTHPTGLLLKDHDGLGRTVVTYHRSGSAGSRLRPDDLESIPWSTVDLMHVTGITPALSASAMATIDAALDTAEAHGVRISFDVNHRSSLWGTTDPTSVYRSIAERAHLIFAGTDETTFLVHSDPLDPSAVAMSIADVYGVDAVVKRGDAGAVAAINGTLWHQAAESTLVVDTVGAGDAFVAGYLAEHLAGAGPQRCLVTAAAAGAAACRHAGDWENAITRADLTTVVTDPVIR